MQLQKRKTVDGVSFDRFLDMVIGDSAQKPRRKTFEPKPTLKNQSLESTSDSQGSPAKK